MFILPSSISADYLIALNVYKARAFCQYAEIIGAKAVLQTHYQRLSAMPFWLELLFFVNESI